MKECRADCIKARKKVAQDAKRARAKLRAHIEKTRKRANELCSICKTTDEIGLNRIDKLIAELAMYRANIDELRRRARAIPVSEKRRAGGVRAAEKRSESDDEVRRNLGDDKEMVALWKVVKHKIKPSRLRSRTEAFFEYVHDHPESLDELRAKRERQWEQEAERLFAERSACDSLSCDDPETLTQSLSEWKRAKKFSGEVPF